MSQATNYQTDLYECQQEAIRAGALDPQGLAEGLAANWLSAQGQSWADGAKARGRLQQWTNDRLRARGYNV